MNNLNTIIDFVERFKNEEDCITYLISQRFQNSVICPHCEHNKVYTFSNGKTWKCALCRKKFNVKTGTIFGGSKISLKKWFLAIFLLTTNKKGISSIQLAEQLGVTQKTAWFMDHRIRETYLQGNKKFNGTVEIDETYVGGKEKNKHASKKQKGTQGRSTKTKDPIVGMVERNGDITAKHVEMVNRDSIKKFIDNNTSENALIVADEYRIYNGIAHQRVNHSQGKYVIDTSHTNTIEGFWSLFKRGVFGIYHNVSTKHLQRYVDEFVYRYNDRKVKGYERFSKCFTKLENSRLRYKDLIDG